MKLSDIAYDPKASVEGIWLTYPNSDIRCLTGRMFNPAMVEWVAKMREELADPITGELSDKDDEAIAFEATIRFVCLKLENAEYEDGTPIVLDVDVARDLFIEQKEKYGHFYAWWVTQANRRELFLQRRIHAQAKKSEASSSGNGSLGTSSESSRPTTPETVPTQSEPGESDPTRPETSPPARASTDPSS